MVPKTFVVLCCFVALAWAGEKYSDKYDNINLEEIMENDRLLNSYSNCMLDKGPCTPEGKELRDHMEDALKNGCEMCTETQKDKSTTMIHFLINKKLDIWKQLTAKYDPDSVWRTKYEDEAKKRGIEIPKE